MIKHYGTFLLLTTGLTLMNACRENNHEPAGEITVMTDKPAEQKRSGLCWIHLMWPRPGRLPNLFCFLFRQLYLQAPMPQSVGINREYMKWAKPYFDKKNLGFQIHRSPHIF